jgi:hypothetical protein
MFEYLINLHTNMTSIGITEDLPYIEKVKIRILNQCTLLGLLGAFLLFLQSWYLERSDWMIETITISLFTFPLFFHALRNYLLAKLIATVFFPVFTLALAVTYGPKSSVEFIYFATILTALIMYENKWAQLLNVLRYHCHLLH